MLSIYNVPAVTIRFLSNSYLFQVKRVSWILSGAVPSPVLFCIATDETRLRVNYINFKIYQFIGLNVVNGVSRSHKTADSFFFI